MELGTERIRKLLVQYAVPAIIAMTASSLYNMVDSIFIGHGVGALAISGLALTFPLMNLAAAFGSLVGVGAATLVSMTTSTGRAANWTALGPDRGRTVVEIDCRPHACTRCEPRRPVAPEMATPSTRVVVAVMVTGRRTR